MTATLDNPTNAPANTCACAGAEQKTKSSSSAAYVTPVVNIFETADGFVLEADMPGVSKAGLEVTIKGNELTLIGRRGPNSPAGEQLFRESYRADFRRVFELGEDIDTARVQGRIEQGLLTISLPKAEKAQPRKITVA
jgi:HSP20 family protein